MGRQMAMQKIGRQSERKLERGGEFSRCNRCMHNRLFRESISYVRPCFASSHTDHIIDVGLAGRRQVRSLARCPVSRPCTNEEQSEKFSRSPLSPSPLFPSNLWSTLRVVKKSVWATTGGRAFDRRPEGREGVVAKLFSNTVIFE